MKNPIIAFHIACIMLGQPENQIQHCAVVSLFNDKQFKNYDEYRGHCDINKIASVGESAWNLYPEPIYF